jgi:hypothetical protein
LVRQGARDVKRRKRQFGHVRYASGACWPQCRFASRTAVPSTQEGSRQRDNNP